MESEAPRTLLHLRPAPCRGGGPGCMEAMGPGHSTCRARAGSTSRSRAGFPSGRTRSLGSGGSGHLLDTLRYCRLPTADCTYQHGGPDCEHKEHQAAVGEAGAPHLLRGDRGRGPGRGRCLCQPEPSRPAESPDHRRLGLQPFPVGAALCAGAQGLQVFSYDQCKYAKCHKIQSTPHQKIHKHTSFLRLDY
jgi:hypothetical protein